MAESWLEERLADDTRATDQGGVYKSFILRQVAGLEAYASDPESPLELQVDWEAFYESVVNGGLS
ncbi:hypothetical protein RI444_10920 [Paenarthrobacter sp. AT5]|uniref:hypothetical protein n=1 Tax=Paenarthrobacter sp. AT5 TaxID=2973089 RepID=UPI002934C03F|nr:hypothetical protein [Paenarthrobacter sp. AT5]WOC59064.1 hypothetical protein RI444_10920 [Paenarthrobacter sp. AT5]